MSYLTEESREIRLNTLQIEELEKSAKELIGSLLRRYQTLRDDLVEQRDDLVDRRSQLVAVPELSRQLESLQNQVVLKRDALNLFQRRLQDAEIQEAGEIQEVSLVERATTAILWPPSSRWFKTVIGIALGTLLGGGVRFDSSPLKTPPLALPYDNASNPHPQPCRLRPRKPPPGSLCESLQIFAPQSLQDTWPTTPFTFTFTFTNTQYRWSLFGTEASLSRIFSANMSFFYLPRAIGFLPERPLPHS